MKLEPEQESEPTPQELAMNLYVERGDVIRLDNGEHVTRGAYDLAQETGTPFTSMEQCKKDAMAREKRVREWLRAQSD